jgi:hypothetical protein
MANTTAIPPDWPIYFVSYEDRDGNLSDPVVMFTGPQGLFNANTYAVAYPKGPAPPVADPAVVWSIAGGTVDVAVVEQDLRFPGKKR